MPKFSRSAAQVGRKEAPKKPAGKLRSRGTKDAPHANRSLARRPAKSRSSKMSLTENLPVSNADLNDSSEPRADEAEALRRDLAAARGMEPEPAAPEEPEIPAEPEPQPSAPAMEPESRSDALGSDSEPDVQKVADQWFHYTHLAGQFSPWVKQLNREESMLMAEATMPVYDDLARYLRFFAFKWGGLLGTGAMIFGGHIYMMIQERTAKNENGKIPHPWPGREWKNDAGQDQDGSNSATGGF